MRVLVCGSRTFNEPYKLIEELNKYEIDTIIAGEARGADLMAKSYALSKGLNYEGYPAQWDTYGKRAGPIRNSQMLVEGKPDLCIAFLGPVAIQEFTSGLSDSKYSKGTKNMIDQARKAGVETVVIDI